MTAPHFHHAAIPLVHLGNVARVKETPKVVSSAFIFIGIYSFCFYQVFNQLVMGLIFKCHLLRVVRPHNERWRCNRKKKKWVRGTNLEHRYFRDGEAASLSARPGVPTGTSQQQGSPKFSSAAAGWAAWTQHTPCKQLSLPALLLLWLAQHFHHYPMKRDVPAKLHPPSQAQ